MTWTDVYSLVDDLCVIEKHTPADNNLPLYYTAKSFFDR